MPAFYFPPPLGDFFGADILSKARHFVRCPFCPTPKIDQANKTEPAALVLRCIQPAPRAAAGHARVGPAAVQAAPQLNCEQRARPETRQQRGSFLQRCRRRSVLSNRNITARPALILRFLQPTSCTAAVCAWGAPAAVPAGPQLNCEQRAHLQARQNRGSQNPRVHSFRQILNRLRLP